MQTTVHGEAQLRFDFLAGGGEMGALMRAYDWASTPLGPPHGWPVALKTTLRLLLTNNHPMFVWWGPELIQFYNDAYRRTLGPERHPAALGQRGRECWREIWDLLGPDVERVMSGGGSVWHEDKLVPVTRHGRREDLWWTYGYSPIEDESGVRGVLVICTEVTGAHRKRETLQRRNRQLAGEVEVHRQAQAALSSDLDRVDAALEKSRGDLAQQVRDWRRLHELSSRLLEARTLTEPFTVVLKAIVDMHRCVQGVISLFDAKAGGLVTQASLGLSEAGLTQLACVPVGAGACGLAFQERRRVFIEDTETDPVYTPYREFAREQGVRALYSTPFFSATGEALGVVSVYFPTPRRPDERELRLTDICVGQLALLVERDRAEKKLHREQQRSHQILETLKDGFVLLDAQYRVLQINAEGLRMDGRPAERILGRTCWEVWPGSERLMVGNAYRHVMRERKAINIVQRYDYFGRETWLDVHAYPYDDGVAVLYRDITENVRAENELARVIEESDRRRRLYETFLSHSPDLAYVFDLEHRFVYANEVLLQTWGRSWDEAIGKTCLELGYEPWHAEMHDREIDQVVATKQPIRGEVPFSGTFGRRIYEYIFVPVIGPDGEVEAVAGTTRDVTERKRIEDDLKASNRRKDEFLAMLAHELRNPLAPISTAAQLLHLPGNDPARIRSAADIIARQVRHMSELVDDLIDVSRVTRGLVRLDRERLDLAAIVAGAVEQVRPLLESRRHLLALRPAAAVMVDGDRTRLTQVLANLLNNAAKYTPPGGRIELELIARETAVDIVVQDDGIGIDPPLLPYVFELFTQAERTPDRSQGGLGIGLALVRSIAGLHGGEVRAESAGLGRGSRFTVTLPRAAGEACDPGAAPTVPAPAAVPLHIMVVDDNTDAALSLAMLLEADGHRVRVSENATQALAQAAADPPRVFILDIGLPDMDGYELARRLRTLPGVETALLVALTGYGQAHDKVLAERSGFDHHFVKPMNSEALTAILAGVR